MATPSRTRLQRDLGDVADQLGWLHHHERLPGLTHDGGPDGFPTEAFVRGDRLVFIVLAPASGRLTPNETAWVDALRDVMSVEIHVARPTELSQASRVLRTDVTLEGVG